MASTICDVRGRLVRAIDMILAVIPSNRGNGTRNGSISSLKGVGVFGKCPGGALVGRVAFVGAYSVQFRPSRVPL